MTYKVTITTNSSFSIKKSSNKFNIQTISGGTLVPAKFSDLTDYNQSGLQDKYIIMYDATTQQYIPVNPDAILSAASNTETTQPGLPNDFINTLGVDLEDKIDMDAGGF